MISPPEWLDQVERCGAAEVPEKVRRPPLERPALRASGGGAGMKFSLVRPVKAVMLGAGGTGGHIAPHLYRLLYALDRPVRFIICDGDVVEKKNLVRQNFIPRRPGGKQRPGCWRSGTPRCSGWKRSMCPEFIESEERLRRLLEPGDIPERTQLERPVLQEQVILIGAVDNNRSRQLCHSVFYKMDELVYIDSGNGMHTGQIVCGIRSGGRTLYRPVGKVYPDVLKEKDKFPTELSCADASLSAPRASRPISRRPPPWWTSSTIFWRWATAGCGRSPSPRPA